MTDAGLAERAILVMSAEGIGKDLFVAAVIIFLVVWVIRPILAMLSRRPRLAGETEEAGNEKKKVLADGSYEDALRAAKDLARREPRIVANVVKEWIGGNE